ncbi:MAG: anion transporter [Gemmatimonadetes bacterium]|nr:anion transporter [Gemmatimonadota bacterium]MBI2537179.1 anion transporter [Gemmatimonadota bacterium]MBI2615997.1 anion transporter [Gemmatimonadota bacterium]
MTTGLVIFAATYLLIAVQRLPFIHLNRPTASLVGAVAMVVFGVLTLEQAYAAVDFDVLVFLLGLMLIVGYLEVGKFFEWAAEWVLERALTPPRLLFAVVVGAGLLSAFFVNDTVCLVVTPVLLAALERLRVRPQPYLIALAMGANVGSVASVTGNPQNMLVGIWSGASFGRFLWHMLPVAVGGLAITYGYLRWALRQQLAEPFPQRLDPVTIEPDRPLVAKGLAMFTVAVVGWLAGGSLPLVAITCGALMVAIARRDPAYAVERVDWDLLLLFSSLFVVMRGLEATGAVAWIDRQALALAEGGSLALLGSVVSGVMVLLSNLISNVPAVMLWRNVVPQLPDPDLMWRIVAMSSTFAGNLLLIGSVANLIVAERAEDRGVKLGFGEYARVGVPVTLLTIAWGTLVLLVGAR